MGLAVGAYERALKFARGRETMGRPIIRHQAIGFKLAQMAVDIEAMRSLTYATSRWLDRSGEVGSREASMKVAVVKTHNTDLALRVCGEAVQIFGAQGIWRSNDVERLFRDAKVSQLVDGPNELMRQRIANTLARG
jgi:alkylation response protein AidB-like acyl-CoA dehydrogenase